ncbi:tumor necrosis factor receptor superfamily member 14-like [Anabas testudineus]|uniref:tumor necrosis factor receptor superfamily member 14-like n=1 Tax=Anabas testudineus TaxID=64144 RepID=UPI000E45A28C|nr:tumor necrosis factor receptor superfamily member 14-like [Anabas testudineus]
MGSGLKIKKSCTITSDAVCEPLEGFYCVEPSDNGCGAAQKHRSCEPGQYISQKGFNLLIWILQLTFSCVFIPRKTLFKMTVRRKHLSAASLLILMIKVFSGQTLTCREERYQVGNECCPMCYPGSRVRTDCSEVRMTSCLPCLEGTYMNQLTSRRQCFPCSRCDEGSGLKMKSPCTITSDTVCEPLEGFFCVDPSDNGCGAAQKHRSCEPGQCISQNGTASTDSVCSDCSDGSFSDGTFPSCRPHTQCETKNLQLLKPGTTSTDAECGEHSSNKTITIIGIIVPVLFLLIVISAAVVFHFRDRIKSSLCSGTEGNGDNPKQETNPETEIMVV